jgi:hypothetical protein
MTAGVEPDLAGAGAGGAAGGGAAGVEVCARAIAVGASSTETKNSARKTPLPAVSATPEG